MTSVNEMQAVQLLLIGAVQSLYLIFNILSLGWADAAPGAAAARYGSERARAR